MKNQRIYSYLILGSYFACGLALGFTLTKKTLLRQNSVTVDIVKEDDEILIYLSRCSEGALRDNYHSEDLIFEYSRTNPTDSSAYREFEDLSKFNRCLSLFSRQPFTSLRSPHSP